MIYYNFFKIAKAIVLFSFVIFIGNNSYGQRYSVEHISEKEGLLNNEISGIYQDSLGFIWVSNRVGFNRINGNEIKSYKAEGYDFYWYGYLTFFSNKTDIEWYKGKINIKSGKISIWDTYITNIQKSLNTQLKLIFTHHKAASFIDKEGYKWAYQEKGKVIRFRENDTIDLVKVAASNGFKIINYSIYKNQDGHMDNDNFIEDNHRNVWVKSKNKLYQYDFVKNRFIQSEIDAYNIASIYIDSKKRIWFTRADYETNLYRFENGIVKTFPATQFNCGRFPQNLSIVEKKNGTIYIASLNGIIEYKNEKFTLHQNLEGIGKLKLDNTENIIASYCKWDYIIEYNKKSELPDKSRIWFFGNGQFINILSVEGHYIKSFIDNQNIIWVGTQNGLFKCVKNDYRKVSFSSIKGYAPFKHSEMVLLTPITENTFVLNNRDFGIWILENEEMRQIVSTPIETVKYYKDSRENIWLIINGNKSLIKITPSLKVSNELTGDLLKEKISPIYSSHSFSFFEQNNSLYIRYPKGLFKLGNNGFEKIKLTTNSYEIIDSDPRIVLYMETNGEEDKMKKVHSVYSLDLTTLSQKQILQNAASNIYFAMKTPEEYILFQDKEIIGISKNDLQKKRIIPYPDQYSQLGIFMRLDGSGKIWFSGNKCLGVFDAYNLVHPFRFFTKKDGLSSNEIHSIKLTLDSTQIIISRPSGIDIVDLAYYTKYGQLSVRKVDKYKDFDPTGTVFPIQSNQIIFSVDYGLIDYNLDFKYKNPQPLLYLKGIKLFGDSINWKEKGYDYQSDFFDVPKKLKLAYSENNITFDFVCVSNINNDKIQFQFKLEGFDENWQKTPFTSITYPNLPPGDYTLFVKVDGNKEDYSSNLIVYHFTVQPAFWQTIWFQLLILAAIISGIFGFIKWKTKTLTRRQKMLEEIIDERTKEIILEKKEVEKQKEVIEEKNRETLDSIQHTKRLQDALLPPARLVKEYHENSFILYRSKELIASDFYWMETIDELTFFAVAESVKKGISGAMLSLIYVNALNTIVKEMGLIDPIEIMKAVNKMVAESSKDAVKMDIRLCVINEKTGILKHSGSGIPFWILRKFNNSIEEINVKTNNDADEENSLTLLSGDILYLFNSGFIKQFEFENKLNLDQLKNELIRINHEPLEIQKEKLNALLDLIIRKEKQTVDVCLISVRYPEKEPLPFTKRELEILQYVVKGLSSKQIANLLFISSHTVDTHRRKILTKANVSNTAELIQYAHQNNI